MEEITINLEAVALLPDNSITDPEMIRQIALHAIQTNDNELLCKIKKEFEYAGLYPNVIKTLDMDPDKYTPEELLTRAEMYAMVTELCEKRKNEKKNPDGSYMAYHDASKENLEKYLAIVKDLKNFIVRNQDYSGAGAIRDIEKKISSILLK
jgi:hypothetical protein